MDSRGRQSEQRTRRPPHDPRPLHAIQLYFSFPNFSSEMLPLLRRKAGFDADISYFLFPARICFFRFVMCRCRDQHDSDGNSRRIDGCQCWNFISFFCRNILAATNMLSSSSFAIDNSCGNSTLRQFMQAGELRFSISTYPNPVTSTAVLKYSLDAESSISITIYDALGRIVASPVVGEMESGGEHEYLIDTKGWAPGIYSCRLSIGDGEMFTRIVVVR
jgi:hypothetical protein